MNTKLKIAVFLLISLGFISGSFAAVEGEKNLRVVKSLSFDPDTAAVSYELAYPAKVRIRIGTKEGPLLRTIVDWQDRGAGLHKEAWDGMDLTGKEKLLGKHDLVFTFNYFTRDSSIQENISLEDIMPLPEQVVIGRLLPSLNINRMHKGHNPEFCHEPELTIKLPAKIQFTEDGYAVITDKIPVTIDIAEKDRAYFRAERYNIHIFIDDVFLTGELEGYSPYNFIFDPAGINEGKHLIAVNYSGFNDHIGIASLPIYIKGEKIEKAE